MWSYSKCFLAGMFTGLTLLLYPLFPPNANDSEENKRAKIWQWGVLLGVVVSLSTLSMVTGFWLWLNNHMFPLESVEL